MAAEEGLEPSTLRLTAACSTIELLRIIAAIRDKSYYTTRNIALSSELCVFLQSVFNTCDTQNAAAHIVVELAFVLAELEVFGRSAGRRILKA